MGRYIDAATLARANALAVKWGVAPHDVLIASLSWQVLLMPLYWLLVSAAAYRAAWQFLIAPFK